MISVQEHVDRQEVQALTSCCRHTEALLHKFDLYALFFA